MNSDNANTPLQKYSVSFCVVGYLLSLALCVFLSLILIPELSRSAHFWPKVCWLTFLATVFWLGVALFLLPLHRPALTRLGVPRIAPGIFCVTTLYCIASATLLVLQSIYEKHSYLRRLHLAGQIVLFVVAAILVLAMGFPVLFAPRSGSPDAKETRG